MPIVVRAAMKPIPTLTKPLPSVELTTLTNTEAHVERSDVCAVPAARVVGEAAAAFVLAAAYLGKFGGDNMDQFVRSVRTYENDLEARGLWRR
jgi:chorismate synthase